MAEDTLRQRLEDRARASFHQPDMTLLREAAHAIADLEAWRSWAPYVYGEDGPQTGTDEELRTALVRHHEAELEELKGEILAAQQARNMLMCAIEPKGALGQDVPAVIALAQAHRQDSEQVDALEAQVSALTAQVEQLQGLRKALNAWRRSRYVSSVDDCCTSFKPGGGQGSAEWCLNCEGSHEHHLLRGLVSAVSIAIVPPGDPVSPERGRSKWGS